MNFNESQQLRNEFRKLLLEPLTELSCDRVLEIIKAIAPDDDEVAHSMEDKFRDAVLKQIDHPLAKKALLTEQIEFSRWCA